MEISFWSEYGHHLKHFVDDMQKFVVICFSINYIVDVFHQISILSKMTPVK